MIDECKKFLGGSIVMRDNDARYEGMHLYDIYMSKNTRQSSIQKSYKNASRENASATLLSILPLCSEYK